jgi:hypothetical protein
MNASGDRRYKRCRGLRHSFGKLKEENAKGFELFVAGFEDEEEEEELKIEIDSKLEKNEGGGDD